MVAMSPYHLLSLSHDVVLASLRLAAGVQCDFMTWTGPGSDTEAHLGPHHCASGPPGIMRLTQNEMTLKTWTSS
jgi:hypothetical protein